MSFETDTLADAARRFSEAIRAERESTLEALAAERQAALAIINALRQEYARRHKAASRRFLTGVLIGASMGMLTVYLLSQRASEEQRLGLIASPVQHWQTSLVERFKRAVEAGRQAARSREEELWKRYRQSLAEGLQPPSRPHEPRF